MRIFQYQSGAQYYHSNEEVAVDDDGGVGVASKIVYTPAQTGTYMVLVHGYDTDDFGSAELWLGGSLWISNINFGGVRYDGVLSDSWCDMDPGDSVHTVYEPGGADKHQLLTTYGAGAAAGVQYMDDQYGKHGARFEHNGSYGQDYFFFVSATDASGSETAISVAFNGASNDTDNDGLGNVLEQGLRTCPSILNTVTADGWDCGSYSSADTDNDGISDYVELFGEGELPMRWWGANPTHKDVFVEVDYFDGLLYGTGGLRQLFNTPQGNNPSHLDGIYTLYTELVATEAENPDGVGGVAVHMDLENPLFDADVHQPNNPALTFDGGGSNQTALTCKDYVDRYNDSMATARRDYFRYACLEAGGQASWARFGIGAHWETFVHELGHTIALGHGGNDSINCKPHYLSLMNYCGVPASYRRHVGAGIQTQFSLGELAGDLNPGDICEVTPLGASADLSFLSGNPHLFDVDAAGSSVDWNLDGDTTDCPTRGPITASWIESGATFVKRETFSDYAVTPTNTPSIAKLETNGVERLYVFYPSSGQHVRYRTMSFPGKCAPSLDPTNCGEWSADYEVPYFGEAVSVARFTKTDGVARLYLTVRYSNGYQYVFQASPIAGTDQLSFSYIMNLGNSIVGTPDIHEAVGYLYVVWRDASNRLWFNKMSNSGVWGSTQQAVDQFNNPWTSNVDPTLGQYNGTTGGIHLLRTDAANQLDFLYYQYGNVWRASTAFNLPLVAGNQTLSKPGLAWTRAELGSNRGYWSIVFPNVANGFMEHVRFGGTLYPVDRIDKFANDWFKAVAGTGTDLVFVDEDENIHGITMREEERKVGGVKILVKLLDFMPYADGMPDEPLTNTSDFEVMAVGACEVLKRQNQDGRPCGASGAGWLILPGGVTGVYGEFDDTHFYE